MQTNQKNEDRDRSLLWRLKTCHKGEDINTIPCNVIEIFVLGNELGVNGGGVQTMELIVNMVKGPKGITELGELIDVKNHGVTG